jgi:hypothetical protein
MCKLARVESEFERNGAGAGGASAILLGQDSVGVAKDPGE